MFYVGYNMPGYLPETDTHECGTFGEAKQALIDQLKFMEDYAYTEAEATEYCHAAEDVNLWSSPGSVTVGNLVYWINEEL
jgi:hypothetical protein